MAEISRKLSDRAEAPRRPARPPTAPIVVPPPAAPVVSPRPEEPSPRTASDKLSFAALWPAERETAVRAIEDAISKADYAEAVRAATALLAETTESLPGPHGGAAPGIKATLLGLDGGLYLRVCRLATMPREALTIADALLALHVLVSARLKVQMLGL